MRGDHPSGGQRPTPEGSLFAPCLQSQGADEGTSLVKDAPTDLDFLKGESERRHSEGRAVS